LRTIRLFLRKLLIKTPGVWGQSIILPRIRYVYDRLPFASYRAKQYAANEAKKIRSLVQTRDPIFTVVYDCDTLGISYGSLLNMLAIARYVISNGGSVKFVIVDTESLDDVDERSPSYVRYMIEDFVKISMTLLDDKSSDVRIVSPASLSEIIQSQDSTNTLFYEFMSARRPFFRDCFNVFNNLMATAPRAIQNRTLFTFSDFEEYFPTSFTSKQYVAWHCRYDLRGTDYGRQTTKDEFLYSYNYLRRRFPNHDIIIISDRLGCQHYSSLASILQIDDILFSKEYSFDFLGDAALIMNSDFFYWFRGGGVSQLGLVSRIPFEMLGPLMNEAMWNKRCLTSWQGDSQRFVVLKKHQFVYDRSLDIDKIGSDYL